MHPTLKASLMLSCCCAAAPMADAAVTILIQQSGLSVVATGSGSISLVGGTSIGNSNYVPAIQASLSAMTLGTGGNATDYSFAMSGPSSFGSGGFFAATSGTGDTFGVIGIANRITLPSGYVSGAPLSGTATWSSQTLAGLGLVDGTYTFSWGTGPTADSLTVLVGSAAVPEPSATLLSLMGITALACCSRSRRPRSLAC